MKIRNVHQTGDISSGKPTRLKTATKTKRNADKRFETRSPIIGRNVKTAHAQEAIKRQPIALPLDIIHPRIRIAHTLVSDSLAIGPRIVFDHEIVLVHKGEGLLHHQGQSIPLAPGSLVFIEPFVPHAFDCPQRRAPVQHSAVHFDLSTEKPAWAADITRRQPYQIQLSHGLAFPVHTALPANHPTITQTTDLIRSWRSPNPLGKLRSSSLLLRILLQLLEKPAAHTSSLLHRHRPQMEKTIRYIHTNFATDMSLEDMAHIASLSRAHFIRLFTQWTGRPPGDYLQRTRIDHARTLLASPDNIPIKQIAALTGFKNPYHFSRVFRKYQGLSPSHFRETLTGAPTNTQINTPC